MKEITTLVKAGTDQASLRTVVPMNIIKEFGLQAGAKLEWEWHEGKDALIVRMVAGRKG